MHTQTVVLGGGCFWGLEELFRKQPGVTDTEVGYAGGENANPTYENHPGHAEVLQITYDPARTSFRNLLDFFFRIHDPTTLNRQGNDQGPSYRSVIFYADDEEKHIAQEMIDVVNASGRWSSPVVTTLEPLNTFWPAEDFHQDYLRKEPDGYTCHFVRGGSYL
ncbi:MAG: Peptide methionine sulfoxide reductase MsrA [Parcubacteria group bacterium GW2011_GWA2_56_7]|nr:MAG: Peptide methionine sulfoxide reductase MsrA [Parcubacteria group bacterium GW2011_GWA2_56_7]